jgi:hypothetical protein
MLLLATLAASFSILSRTTHAQPTDTLNTPEAQVLIDRVRERGGFMDPRQSIRHEVPTDPTTIRGVFAEAPIAEGELLLRVPWELCIAPTEEESQRTSSQCMCDTEKNVREALLQGNASMHGPYAHIMRAKEMELPNLWSAEERALLVRLLGDELPPKPQRLTTHLDWWTGACNGDLNDQLAVHSILLVVTRGVEVHGFSQDPPARSIMAPIYDLYNHRNGVWLNTRVRAGAARDFEMYASKDIAAGEQLYNSYGSGSDELFVTYGFTEQYPQQWAFDVDVNDDGSTQRVQFTLDASENAKGQENLGAPLTVAWEGQSFQSVPSLDVVAALEALLGRLKSRRADEGIDAFAGNESPHFGLIKAYISAVQTALESAAMAGRIAHSETSETARHQRTLPSEEL